MENREEVVKQSLSLQILGAQLLVQVGLSLKISSSYWAKWKMDLRVRSAQRLVIKFRDLRLIFVGGKSADKSLKS